MLVPSLSALHQVFFFWGGGGGMGDGKLTKVRVGKVRENR